MKMNWKYIIKIIQMKAIRYHMFVISLMILLVNAFLVSRFWFSNYSEILQYGDGIFPWDIILLLKKHLYVWTTINGGVYSARTFGWLIISIMYLIFYLLSKTLTFMEMGMFTFLLSLSGISMYFFLNQLNRNEIVPNFIAALLYMYSPYQAVIWSGIHMTSIYFYSVFPLFLGMCHRFMTSKGENKRLMCAIPLVSALLFPAFSNIPFLIITILVIGAYLITNRHYTIQNGKHIILLLILIILINSWFILPFLEYLNSSSTQVIAPVANNAVKWATWKSLYANLPNLIRMLGSVYFHGNFKGEAFCVYCSIYNSPLLFFSGFLIFIIATSTFLIKSERYNPEKYFFGLLLLISLNLSMGMNSPIFRFMITHFPFFFIFRSPWEKFMSIYIFSLSVLLSFSISLCRSIRKKLILIILVILLISPYIYPVMQGKMFPTKESRKILPPSHVSLPLPSYVYSTARYMNTNEGTFRVLLLPDLDRAIFYWGFSSNSHLIPYLIDKDVAGNYPGPPMNSFDKLREYIIRAMYFRNEDVSDMLGLLNIRYIIQRNDIIYSYFGGIDSPTFVKSRIMSQKDIFPIKTIGQWNIYSLSPSVFLPRIYPAIIVIKNYGKGEGILAITTSNEYRPGNNVIITMNLKGKIEKHLLQNYNFSIPISNETFLISPKNGNKKPFNWNNLSSNSIEARYYYGWKSVIRTDGREQEDTLSFQSLDKCPYTFPSYKSTGWNALNSTLIYVKTGSKSLIISKILENNKPVNNIVGVWWQTGWMGMGTKPVEFPIVIPPNQQAIIQINHIIQGNITMNILDISNLSKLTEIKQQHVPKLTFKKVNPTTYIISVENATHPFFLVFSESYHPQWKLYIEDRPVNFTRIIEKYPNINVEEAEHDWYKFTPGDIVYLFRKPSLNETYHFKANGYANAWYINPEKFDKDGDGKFTITIYFWPQSLFYLGLFISGTTLFGCVGYLFYDWRRERGDRWTKKMERKAKEILGRLKR